MSRLFRKVLSESYAQVQIDAYHVCVIVNGDLNHVFVVRRARARNAFEIQRVLKEKFGGQWILVA